MKSPYTKEAIKRSCASSFWQTFFGGSSDPGGSENHNGIKYPGGRGVPVAHRLMHQFEGKSSNS